MNAAAPEAAIRALIEASNRAWRGGRTRELAELLHPDVTFVGPQLEAVAEGRAACLRSYDEFLAQAEVQEFEERPAVVRVVGSTAVATYEWSIAYSIAGRRYDERGREILVCVRGKAGWRIAWRAQFPVGSDRAQDSNPSTGDDGHGNVRS